MYFKIIIKLDELATGLTIQQLHAFLPMYLLLVHNDDDDDGKTSFLVFDNIHIPIMYRVDQKIFYN